MIKNIFRILVCPLDWGIGHATRCVQVIRCLQQQKHEVIIAADGRPLDFLREYFPDLEYIRLPGFKVSYPSGNKMLMKMMLQSPSILYHMYKEHQLLKKTIRDCGADVVISDNRFGLWSKQAYSIYMTHQVMIKAPGKMTWTEPYLHNFHKWFIKHYDECWIPDLPGERNLSGDLSHLYPLPENSSFIGILSRFEKCAEAAIATDSLPAPDLLVMLSGPEPQRSIFEKLVLEELPRFPGLNVVILQGLPGKSEAFSPLPGVSVISHLPDPEMKRLICRAGLILCRPGYSTVMDLVTLGRNAVLVPTPGQTEQEYLAGHLTANGLFRHIAQEEFNLDAVLHAGRQLAGPIIFQNDVNLLEKRIHGLQNNLASRRANHV